MTSRDAAAGVDALMAAQDGLISRAQAREKGLSRSGIDRRLASGAWRAVLPGVFRSAQVPPTVAARIRAAALWAGARGTLCGASAAWWWGLTKLEPALVEVILPRAVRRRAPAGVSMLRRDLDPRDRTVRHGVAVTALPLSALHGAVALGSPAGPMMLDRALQRQCRFDEVLAAYHRQLGSHRSAGARRLMAAAGDRAAAESERRFIRLLKGADIHGWTVNAALVVRGADYFPDFCFRSERLIVELDGWAWHHSPDRFRHDRHRQNDLMLAGWIVLRFTWFDLVERPDWVLGQVRSALLARRAG
jgi:very-short-patch-repair endonuclease